jgi:hypothetical protein
MCSTRQLVAVLSFAVLAACQDRPALDVPVPSKAAAPSPPPSSGGGSPLQADAGAALQKTPPEQQPVVPEAGVVGTAPPPPAQSCEELAAGGSSDKDSGFLVWQLQVTPGESSAALDFVSLGYSCGLKYQHANNVTVLDMNPADCAATHAWATNARFLEILRTGDGCASGDGKGNATESFEVSLSNGEHLARKTSRCPEPTLDLERGCFRALIDRLFPAP